MINLIYVEGWGDVEIIDDFDCEHGPGRKLAVLHTRLHTNLDLVGDSIIIQNDNNCKNWYICGPCDIDRIIFARN